MFDVVAPVAAELLGLLKPACERLAVAGSLRRRKASVHDIELVAIPRVTEGEAAVLFPDHADPTRVDALALLLALLRDSGTLVPRAVEVHRKDGSVEIQERDGAKYKALVYRGIPVDLFITRRESWGVTYAIRTGPGDWNEKLVTDCQRYFRRLQGTTVLHLGRPVACPEEADFFRALGQPWVEPAERSVDRVRIDPALFAVSPA